MPDFHISAAEILSAGTYFFPRDGIIYPDNDALLIKILVRPLVYGENIIDLVSFKYNETEVNNLIDGSVIVKVPKKIAYLNIANKGTRKNIFNPEMGEEIIISYGTKTGYLSKAVARIYDAQGRLVLYTCAHKYNFCHRYSGI